MINLSFFAFAIRPFCRHVGGPEGLRNHDFRIRQFAV